MWHWLDDPGDHEYTKDVDFAVGRDVTPAVVERLRSSADATVRLLPIGGVNARIDSSGIRADFVDRSSEEYGDLNPLYVDAIHAANLSEDRASGVPVASPEHLVAMKIGAGTEKDDRDAIRLIAKIEDLDVDKVRELIKKHLGPGTVGRLDECMRRAGHPKARRAYSAGS
ncbi:MAG: hypothetical protein HY904_18130 [Deltaproteobacteria bacterium]|nr:hypothetical protein [Deltaproteobacteria bacterium]